MSLLLRAQVVNTVQVDARQGRGGEAEPFPGYKKIQVLTERRLRDAGDQINVELVDLYLDDLGGCRAGQTIEVEVWPYKRGAGIGFAAVPAASVKIVGSDRGAAA